MFIRYPGSKDKIKPKIIGMLPVGMTHSLWSEECRHYCEPFFGSGAIGWRLFRGMLKTCSILVNDIDPGMAALWRAVHGDHQSLIDKVTRFKPSVENFNLFKAEDGRTDLDTAEQGFRKLALHQMSFSGLGYKAGGPIGGQEQSSKYNVNARWSPPRLALGIKTCSMLSHKFRHFRVECVDFAKALQMVPPYRTSVVYLDPPYYVQGSALYRYSMTDEDHRRLADILRAAKFRWLLSYDDHERIKELYSFATITTFEMTPSVQTAKVQRRKNNELLIRNFQ